MKKVNWGTSILIYFMLFISVAISFIVFAFNQTNDLVTDDYYEQGANYSNTVNIIKRSAVFTDSITILQTNSTLQIITAPTIASTIDSMKIQFYSASNRKLDKIYTVSTMQDTLRFNSNDMSKSLYTVKIAWWVGTLEFRKDSKILIQ